VNIGLFLLRLFDVTEPESNNMDDVAFVWAWYPVNVDLVSCHSCDRRQLSFLRRQESTTLSRLLSEQHPQIQL